jgi:hypothetical protein
MLVSRISAIVCFYAPIERLRFDAQIAVMLFTLGSFAVLVFA